MMRRNIGPPKYSPMPPSFDAKPQSVGRPRLDAYHRLLSRFYEPLIFLRVLEKSGREPTPRPSDLNAAEATRRKFLRNLSFICDYERGGNTCTAIGLEDSSTCYTFWVASNEGQEKITLFLEFVLDFLKCINFSPERKSQQNAADFSEHCVDFANKRIEKEKKCLFAAIRDCCQALSCERGNRGKRLSEWLDSLLGYDDNYQLCMFAYDTRQSEFLSQLRIRAAEQERMSGPAKGIECFGSTRHLFGRLAHHIRASRELLDDAKVLNFILQSFKVRAIRPMSCVSPPAYDNHTHLNGCLNRMLGKDCNEKLEIENGLWKINAIKSVFEDFVAEYRRTKPRIHAEVQVLEHFYINKMVFAENDPYIACSKPACLCCEMYFKYHPARMIVPESHRNIWANWGPPIVENYSKWTPAGRRQLDILNSMIQELREMIIREALGQSRAGNWHPDSMTGITEIYHYDQLNNFNNFIPDKVLASRVGDSELSVDLEKARDSEDDSDIDDGGVSINS